MHITVLHQLNSLRPRQNGRRFPDDTFKRIFLNENVRISIKISLKFVPQGPINDIPALVLIMAWRRPGAKPLSEPMMVSLPTHICVTRPQWVNLFLYIISVIVCAHVCTIRISHQMADALCDCFRACTIGCAESMVNITLWLVPTPLFT